MRKKVADRGAKKAKQSVKKGVKKKTAPKAEKGVKRATAKKAGEKKIAAKKTTKKAAPQKKTAKKTTQTATRKAPAARPTSPKISRPVVPRIAPSVTSTQPTAPPAPPAPPAARPIGIVTHYYSHLNVAVVQLNEGTLRVGEMIHIKGHTTDLKQPVESIEIDHEAKQEVSMGEIFGLKVRDHVREHDQIYKVSGP